MPAYPINAERYRELARKLEASADRFHSYEERLFAIPSPLKAAEYDNLLAMYNIELERYDRLERELFGAEKQTCLKEKQAQNLRKNQKNREKITY